MVMVKVQQEHYYAYQYAKLQHTSSRTLHSILGDYGCVLKEHLLDTNTATHREYVSISFIRNEFNASYYLPNLSTYKNND